jgi:uncharacterized protein YndB with AHSA1/START domain
MTVTSTRSDPEALTLTVVAEFEAPVERVWQVWEDPRQLERWWGPPTWPATFARHDFVAGGESRYVMTGPDGETAGGWWRMTAVEPTHRLEWEDGFADASGDPDPSMPVTRAEMTLERRDGTTVMTTVSRFDSLEQLEQLIAMGMLEGLRLAMGQIDDLLETVPAGD